MAYTYNVYFGLPGDLVQIATEQVELSIVVPYYLDYNSEYNWRVDTVTDSETITGDTWSFTTIVFDPPAPPVDSDGLGGTGSAYPTGENSMIAVRRVVAAAENKIYYENIGG